MTGDVDQLVWAGHVHRSQLEARMIVPAAGNRCAPLTQMDSQSIRCVPLCTHLSVDTVFGLFVNWVWKFCSKFLARAPRKKTTKKLSQKESMQENTLHTSTLWSDLAPDQLLRVCKVLMSRVFPLNSEA